MKILSENTPKLRMDGQMNGYGFIGILRKAGAQKAHWDVIYHSSKGELLYTQHTHNLIKTILTRT